MKELRQGGTTLLARYDWDALSRRSKITFGNNTTASYAYRANDDLATIAHQLKTSAVTFSYKYNQAHQRTQAARTFATATNPRGANAGARQAADDLRSRAEAGQ